MITVETKHHLYVLGTISTKYRVLVRGHRGSTFSNLVSVTLFLSVTNWPLLLVSVPNLFSHINVLYVVNTVCSIVELMYVGRMQSIVFSFSCQRRLTARWERCVFSCNATICKRAIRAFIVRTINHDLQTDNWLLNELVMFFYFF